MQVTKCDICKKQIKSYKEEVNVRPPTGLENFVFCLNCGNPVMKFLMSRNLIEKKAKK